MRGGSAQYRGPGVIASSAQRPHWPLKLLRCRRDRQCVMPLCGSTGQGVLQNRKTGKQMGPSWPQGGGWAAAWVSHGGAGHRLRHGCRRRTSALPLGRHLNAICHGHALVVIRDAIGAAHRGKAGVGWGRAESLYAAHTPAHRRHLQGWGVKGRGGEPRMLCPEGKGSRGREHDRAPKAPEPPNIASEVR